MTRIAIVGTGNLARHLFQAFESQKDVKIVQVLGRNREALAYFKSTSNVSSNFSQVADADVYFIAVKDDAVSLVSQSLPLKEKLLVHCSGSLSIETLSSDNAKGVFYPLQTFSAGVKADFQEIPICLEAKQASDLLLLQKLATSISTKVFEVSSKQRRSLHLAAVFVNNFTNHMYHIGNEICKENELPFEVLLPLIKETSGKLERLSPYEAQTGPARRQDTNTIKLHQQALNNQNYSEIYSLLSKSIQNLYGDKL